MKIQLLLLAVLGAAFSTGCGTFGGGARTASAVDRESLHPNHPARSDQHLLEVLHYCFLWHYDRSFLRDQQREADLVVYFRGVKHELDEGDESEFAQLWLPSLRGLIDVKRSDYPIPEFDLQIRDDNFKVRRVVRTDEPPFPLSSYEKYVVEFSRIRDWFAENVTVAEPLTPLLKQRLRETIVDYDFRDEQDLTVTQTFFVAPMSPASDELWVFHENNRHFLQFTADMDLNNPEYWAKTPIHLEVHPLIPEELLAPAGSMTAPGALDKDFVGRALFNCMVLGERIDVPPEEVRAVMEENARRRAQGDQ